MFTFLYIDTQEEFIIPADDCFLGQTINVTVFRSGELVFKGNKTTAVRSSLKSNQTCHVRFSLTRHALRLYISEKYCLPNSPSKNVANQSIAIFYIPYGQPFCPIISEDIAYETDAEEFLLIVLHELMNIARPDDPSFRYKVIRKPLVLSNPITFQTLTSGFLTSFGYNGVATYGIISSYGQRLNVPQGSVVMLSFLRLDIGHVVSPDNYCLQGQTYFTILNTCKRNSEQYVLRLCSGPSPGPLIVNCSLIISFRTIDRDGENLGFKVLFSFHPTSQSPTFYNNTQFLDCSQPDLYQTFQQHVACNMEKECSNGKDEEDCPFISPDCPNGTYRLLDNCIYFVTHSQKLSWLNANKACHKGGARLINLSFKDKFNALRELMNIRRDRSPFYTGAHRPMDFSRLPQLYYWQWFWPDSTVAFNLNISYRCYNDCWTPSLTPFGTIFLAQDPKFLFAVSTDKEVTDHYICELALQMDRRKQTNLENVQIAFPSINFTHKSLSLVQCHGNHFTHNFLSCDPDSRCRDSAYLTSCEVEGRESVVKFVCEDSSGVTLPYTLLCNFRRECPDGSDEIFCVPEICPEAQCGNGKCITYFQLCDVVSDCDDGLDEQGWNEGTQMEDTNQIFNTTECWIERSYTQMSGNFAIIRQQTSPTRGIVDMVKHAVSYNLKVLPVETDEGCPETHFRCPAGLSYCLPVYVRCNGVSDCPDKEDETGCSQYTCPGLYRCRGAAVCLHPRHLCDGLPQCPQHDDEWLCQRQHPCPAGCSCQGLAYVCPRPFPVRLHNDLRYLNASRSLMTLEQLQPCWYLVHAILSSCRLKVIGVVSLPNLRVLDLNDNQIKSINVASFSELLNLRTLRVTRNPLVTITACLHTHFEFNLMALDISHCHIAKLDVKALSAFKRLQVLNVSNCKIDRIDENGFRPTPNLTSVDLSSNPLTYYPAGLFQTLRLLQAVRVDDYRLCCRHSLPPGLPVDMCQSVASPVSSCDRLLGLTSHRYWLWTIAALSLCVNAFSLIYRMTMQNPLQASQEVVSELLLTSLQVTDALMGVALLVVTGADVAYSGHFASASQLWVASGACRAAAFLSAMSSQCSALTVCCISLDRALAVARVSGSAWLPPCVSRCGCSPRAGLLLCALVWTLAAFVAMLLLLSARSFLLASTLCLLPLLSSPTLQTTSTSMVAEQVDEQIILPVTSFTLFVLTVVVSTQTYVMWTTQGQISSILDFSQLTQVKVAARRFHGVVGSSVLTLFPVAICVLFTTVQHLRLNHRSYSSGIALSGYSVNYSSICNISTTTPIFNSNQETWVNHSLTSPAVNDTDNKNFSFNINSNVDDVFTTTEVTKARSLTWDTDTAASYENDVISETGRLEYWKLFLVDPALLATLTVFVFPLGAVLHSLLHVLHAESFRRRLKRETKCLLWLKSRQRALVKINEI